MNPKKSISFAEQATYFINGHDRRVSLSPFDRVERMVVRMFGAYLDKKYHGRTIKVREIPNEDSA